MITFDNGNCLIVLATHKMMRRHTIAQLKQSMKGEILPYLLGESNTITTRVIDKFLKLDRLKKLTKNIKKYIINKKLGVNEEQVFQVFLDKTILVRFLIDLKGINKFLKTLSIKEMFILLGIRDFIKLDLEENSFYNVVQDKPEFYLKWKRI